MAVRWKLHMPFVALAFGLTAPVPASPGLYTMTIAGSSMACLSWRGQPVTVVATPELPTLARAYSRADGTPTIEINPHYLGRFSPVVQQWWFAHECAHHELPPQLNSEQRADCRAGRRMKRMARITAHATAIRRELGTLPGSELGHLPGEERAELILKCAGVRDHWPATA